MVFVTSTMAYRGQGQKVQKVMVQPIVSYAACELWALGGSVDAVSAGGEQGSLGRAASREAPGRPRWPESARR